MTHDTDCRVLDEFRDEVEEIAAAFWRGDDITAEHMAEQLGWEKIGGGAGRVVYRVAPNLQEGPTLWATHEQPCVIKFAIPGHRYDGLLQNREEINQFQRFPKEMTTGEETDEGVPIVVPIRDWDQDESRWISMPEAQVGGSIEQLRKRLALVGWTCEDVHLDNVSEMHGVSVLHDYGLDCEEKGTPEGIAHQVADWLDALTSVRAITVVEQERRWVIAFTVDDWVLETAPSPKDSAIFVNNFAEVTGMEIAVGGYPTNGQSDQIAVAADYDPPLFEAAFTVIEELKDDWFDIDVEHVFKTIGELMTVMFKVTFREEPPPPDRPGEIVDDLLGLVHRHFPGGEVHTLGPEAVHLEPEEGMIIDHPEIGLVRIENIDDKGNIRAVDRDDVAYNLRGEVLTQSMLVESERTLRAVESILDDIQKEIDEAMNQAVAELD